jgi:hypothetical protein
MTLMLWAVCLSIAIAGIMIARAVDRVAEAIERATGEHEEGRWRRGTEGR